MICAILSGIFWFFVLGLVLVVIESICIEIWSGIKFVTYTIGDNVLKFFGK